MHATIGKRLAIVAAYAALATIAAKAQTSSLPPNYIQVNAPFAQRIVVEEMQKHSNQIQKIGLHAVPPGATDNVIIASNLPGKIGKKSSQADLAIVAAGKPHVLRDEKGRFYDLAFPITDREGKDLGGGLLVMEVPFVDASSEEEALKIGAVICNGLKMQIDSKDELYH